MQVNSTVLNSIVQLTQERNKKSLAGALVKTLSNLIEFESVLFLHVPQDNLGLEVAVAIPEHAAESKLTRMTHNSKPPLFHPDEPITHCIRDQHVVLVEDATATRCYFPVKLNNRVVGVLAVYGYQRSENSDVLIGGFLSIYSNFLAVLDENEHDTLTQLLNRKTFDACISEFIAKASSKNIVPLPEGKDRRNANLSNGHWLGVLDIDHFKKINDGYGHIYGDEVLLLFSNIMKKSFRSNDMLFRYGGEEFVVVLSPTSEANALMVFERFRRAVELFDFPQVGRVTVSVGMVEINAQEHQSTVIERADQALYYAKEHGRNQVCVYQHLAAAGLLTKRHAAGDIQLF